MRLLVLKEKYGETWILALCMLVSLNVLSGFYTGHPQRLPQPMIKQSQSAKPSSLEQPPASAKTQVVYRAKQNK